MNYYNNNNKKRNIIIVVIIIVAALAIAGLVIFLFLGNKNKDIESTTAVTIHEVTTAAPTTATTKDTAAATTAAATKNDYNDGFTDADDQVTAKDQTNLHVTASNSSDVVVQLQYGTYITRVGVSDNGWSKLLYNGETVYARTQLLLAEGETRASITPWVDEYNMTYQDVEDQVTAKEEVNLRSVPSSKDDGTIIVKIKAGEYVTRIGIGDKGWSKLIYNDQIVYAITSYLTN